jgi:hypothetical protein
MKFKGHDEAWGVAQDKEYTRSIITSRATNTIRRWISSAMPPWRALASLWAGRRLAFPRLVGWQKGDEFEATRAKSQ